MKKLLLILSITSAAFGMDSENDPRSIISKQAAHLHEFLTENLDNQEANPDDKTVDDLADKLNALSLNPAVLLDLKDKRSREEYNFKRYISAKQQQNQRCFILNERAAGKSHLSFFSCHVDDPKPLPDQAYKHKTSQEEPIASISIDDPVNGKQRERHVTQFALLANGDKEYASGSTEYSLIDLLVACKRPGIISALLNRSRYIPRFPNNARLKQQCVNQKGIEKWKIEWQELGQKLDDAADLATATNLALAAKTTALHHAPSIAFVASKQEDFRHDAMAMRHLLSPSTRLEHITGSLLSIDYELPNGERSFTYITSIGHLRTLALLHCLQRAIWHPLVDAVEDYLDVDERSAAALSIKPVAQAVISATKACKQLPGYLKSFVTSQETSQHSNN